MNNPTPGRTNGHQSVEQYVETYGFCHWQAQEVIKARDAANARVIELVFELDKLRQQLKAKP